MEQITAKDKAILRELAARKAEYAHDEKNKEILKKWSAQEAGRRENPTVRLLFSNLTDEIITPRMRCEGKLAREIESSLICSMTGRELFDDDTPVSDTFDMHFDTWVKPFGSEPKREKAKNSGGYHIEPIVEDLEEDIDKLRGGAFGADLEKTNAYRNVLEDTFGDILPTRLQGAPLLGAITNPLVHLMGMENYYISMYDYPELLHEVMDMATTVYEQYYDFLEREKLLLPTVGMAPVNQESYAFTNELPLDNVTKTTECWGFLESQETTAVSPDTFGEFVFPYQDRLVKRMGLLSYGCCERVDAIFEDYLSRWSNLRKLSVSPFNNEEMVGEFLRGSRIVYYSKPRAELVTDTVMDEDALRRDFKRICEAASGCLFEIGQREVMTLRGDMSRGKDYVRIAKECVEKYWKP